MAGRGGSWRGGVGRGGDRGSETQLVCEYIMLAGDGRAQSTPPRGVGYTDSSIKARDAIKSERRHIFFSRNRNILRSIGRPFVAEKLYRIGLHTNRDAHCVNPLPFGERKDTGKKIVNLPQSTGKFVSDLLS